MVIPSRGRVKSMILCICIVMSVIVTILNTFTVPLVAAEVTKTFLDNKIARRVATSISLVSRDCCFQSLTRAGKFPPYPRERREFVRPRTVPHPPNVSLFIILLLYVIFYLPSKCLFRNDHTYNTILHCRCCWSMSIHDGELAADDLNRTAITTVDS